jgi:hypothetical protein
MPNINPCKTNEKVRYRRVILLIHYEDEDKKNPRLYKWIELIKATLFLRQEFMVTRVEPNNEF